MIAVAPTIRLIARSNRDARPSGAGIVAASALADAVAVGLLLLGRSLPPAPVCLLAAVAHGTALLLMTRLGRERQSRRWLCGAAILAVPCVGVAIAAAVLLTRGRGSAAMEHGRMARRRRPRLTPAAIHRVVDALSPCEALECGDGEQQRAALSQLSGRGDAEAIVLLHRAAASHDPDLALSAALVLDEISERAERRAARLNPAAVRYGTA